MCAALEHPVSKPPAEVLSAVLQKLGHFHPLSEGLTQALTDKSFETRFKKGEHLVKVGEYCHHFYFLIEGIITGYRNRGSKRLTTFICLEGDVVSAIAGMYGISPAIENMVASEDAYLIALSATDLLEFCDLYPEMNIVMRKILEIFYQCAHERSVISRMGTAQEKYNYYLKTLPGHNDRVDIELVASFLDMKVETLIKIKKVKVTECLATKADTNTKKLSLLLESMLIEKLYQRKKLSLNDLAAHLKFSTHELSQLLNQAYYQNFAEFINSYRVHFVKEQLKSKTNFELTTIEALGDEAGFSSKSSFFSVFKKLTGLSPLGYAKSC